MQKKLGKIITFYSYKGGTGRSMLLANIAWVLATNGKKVLVIDWDLEAPGLHRYFAPFLIDKELETSDGLIDFFIEFVREANIIGKKSNGELPDDWYFSYADIMPYASSLDYDFIGDGIIDFVPAGRQDKDYATKINLFNWQDFYDRYGGGVLLEATKDIIRREYDYILVDSRTGVSDTSGICTVQFPDILVVLYTLNNQSIKGAAAVAKSVVEQKSQIVVFPVTARIDVDEKDKVDLRLRLARNIFAPFIEHISPDERMEYWLDVEIPYIPYYSYEEVLAVFADTVRKSLLIPVENITRYLTGKHYKMPKISAGRRKEILDSFMEQDLQELQGEKKKQIFISYRRDDSYIYVKQLHEMLEINFGQEPVFFDEYSIAPGEDFVKSLENSISNCEVMIVVIGQKWLSSYDSDGRRRIDNPNDFIRLEISAALNRDIRVIPALVGGAAMPSTMDLPDDLESLARRNAIVLRDDYFRKDAERLIRALDKFFAQT